MKFASTIFAAVFVALLPSAQAQASLCKFYEDLIAASATGFESYRGKPISPGTNTATINPPRYPNCIAVSRGEFWLVCNSLPGPEVIARTVYRSELVRLRRCLAGWMETPWLGAEVEGEFEGLDGLRFVRQTVDGELTFGIGLVREKAGKRGYMVGFGVIWKPLPTGV